MKNVQTLRISEHAFVHYFHPNEEGFENVEMRRRLNEWLENNNVESLSYDSENNRESDEADSALYLCPILDLHDTQRTVSVLYK